MLHVVFVLGSVGFDLAHHPEEQDALWKGFRLPSVTQLSLDAGVMMEGIPALTVWESVLNVLAPHSIHSNPAAGSRSPDIFSNQSTSNRSRAASDSESDNTL